MREQVLRLLQMPTPCQISGSRANDEVRQCQLPDYKITLQSLLPDGDNRNIEIFIRSVNRTGCDQLQLNARKSLLECRDVWDQLMYCKSRWAQDAQISTGRSIEIVCQGVCILQVRQDAFYAFQVLCAYCCQNQAARRAVHQADAQMIFEVRHCAGNHRRGEV